MEALKDTLWPIIVVGGLGAFIDFLIGRTGQASAKDFLLRWWVRFDDVHWKNFGREEGIFAGHLMQRWFGNRMWSFRRLVTALALLILLPLLGILYEITSPEPDVWCFYCKEQLYGAAILRIVLLYISFSLSMSFTIFLTFKLSYLCDINKRANLLILSQCCLSTI